MKESNDCFAEMKKWNSDILLVAKELKAETKREKIMMDIILGYSQQLDKALDLIKQAYS